MADYTARVLWQRQPDEPFTDQRYHRRHLLRFDGGAEVAGSSSPHSVPLPYSDPSAVDPEEALVAAVSSCHMLWFLSLAARAGFVVDDYRDDATGTMARNGQGRLAITTITLRPAVRFAGEAPDTDTLTRLHHQAHDECYIAHSVTADVRCEPQVA
ncbi:OsmC family protein [Ideonella sp. DXS29W]|uniref:OsmC family protein n=1 Tax=Ideonella lacteola TaxID=2984193 RepID=A0ABU9BUI9_9BURK